MNCLASMRRAGTADVPEIKKPNTMRAPSPKLPDVPGRRVPSAPVSRSRATFPQVRCLFLRKEGHSRGDLFGRSGAAQGCALRTNFQLPRPVHRGGDRSRRDGIDANSFIVDLPSRALSHAPPS
jgi:hypothetical protein